MKKNKNICIGQKALTQNTSGCKNMGLGANAASFADNYKEVVLEVDGLDIKTMKIYESGRKCFYRNGLYHNEDGPAIIYPDGKKRYLLNGHGCDYGNWLKLKNII